MSNSKDIELGNIDKKSFEGVLQEVDNEIEFISTDLPPSSDSNPPVKRSVFKNFVDSFKAPERDNYSKSEGIDGISEEIDEDSTQTERKDNDQLKQTIKPRHVMMISLGTGIGTGLLVGNGSALGKAGPAGLVIGYGIMGSCIYCIIQAAGEMAVVYSNLAGGFNSYPSMFVDPGFGFAVAWVYCIQWLCVCPLELVTASITIKYWTTKVNPDIFVAIFTVLIIGINVFGARGYAEAEFIFNCCKVLMMAGFFLVAIITNAGGAGNDGYIGAKYWHDPGAFRGDKPIDHFKGVVSTLVTAAFAFGGTEFIALTAAEQSNPRKAIPAAAKKVLYRIFLVYLTSIILIGFLVPFNSPQLLGSGAAATAASPYVIAVASHGVRVVPHFINAVILISVLSVGNSAFYSSSRLLLSLAKQGYAPKFFDYVDRTGRPSRAMLCSALFNVIAFCAASPKEDDVFTWLLAISGLSQLFTWTAICLSHIRFRDAMRVQNRSLGEIGFKSQTGVWGSWWAIFIMVLTLIGQFWVALAPIGGEKKIDAESFFQNYLAMPILIVFYFGYKVWKKDWRLFIKAENIDLDSHRTVFDEELLKQEDFEFKEKLKHGPMWRRIVEFWC